jgi:hypothetical protein
MPPISKAKATPRCGAATDSSIGRPPRNPAVREIFPIDPVRTKVQNAEAFRGAVPRSAPPLSAYGAAGDKGRFTPTNQLVDMQVALEHSEQAVVCKRIENLAAVYDATVGGDGRRNPFKPPGKMLSSAACA